MFLLQPPPQQQHASRSIASMRLMGVRRAGEEEGMEEKDSKNFLFVDGGALVPAPTGGNAPPLPWRTGGGDGDALRRVQRAFAHNMRVLFVIERDINSNVVVYGLPGPGLAPPTRVFWLMAATAAAPTHTEELTLLERKYAYGIETVSASSAAEVLRVKALGDDDVITVRPHADDGEYYAMLRMFGRDVILRRIYICTEPGLLFGHTTTEMHVEVLESPRAAATTTYYFRL